MPFEKNKNKYGLYLHQSTSLWWEFLPWMCPAQTHQSTGQLQGGRSEETLWPSESWKTYKISFDEFPYRDYSFTFIKYSIEAIKRNHYSFTCFIYFTFGMSTHCIYIYFSFYNWKFRFKTQSLSTGGKVNRMQYHDLESEKAPRLSKAANRDQLVSLESKMVTGPLTVKSSFNCPWVW